MHGELNDQPQAVLQQRGALRCARAPREDTTHALRLLRLSTAAAVAFVAAKRAAAGCGTVHIWELFISIAADTNTDTAAAAAAAAIAAGIAAAVLANTTAIATATDAVSAAANVGCSEDLKWAPKDVRDRSLKTESDTHPLRLGVAIIGVDGVRRERGDARPEEAQVAKSGKRSVERVRVASLRRAELQHEEVEVGHMAAEWRRVVVEDLFRHTLPVAHPEGGLHGGNRSSELQRRLHDRLRHAHGHNVLGARAVEPRLRPKRRASHDAVWERLGRMLPLCVRNRAEQHVHLLAQLRWFAELCDERCERLGAAVRGAQPLQRDTKEAMQRQVEGNGRQLVRGGQQADGGRRARLERRHLDVRDARRREWVGLRPLAQNREQLPSERHHVAHGRLGSGRSRNVCRARRRAPYSPVPGRGLRGCGLRVGGGVGGGGGGRRRHAAWWRERVCWSRREWLEQQLEDRREVDEEVEGVHPGLVLVQHVLPQYARLRVEQLQAAQLPGPTCHQVRL
eukprot:scaffold63711_cov30-Phaeocystis_antarctica.AAC.1